MKVFNYPKMISKKETTLILGAFESIHNGHASLIAKAKTFGNEICVLIIKDPSKIPNRDNNNYLSLELRLEQLSELGVDFVSVLDFTDHVKRTSGKNFIEKIIKITTAENIVVGEDYTFGHNKSNTSKDILNMHRNVYIEKILKVNRKKIGTTLLKESVAIGDVESIKTFSPFPFTVNIKISNTGKFDTAHMIIPHSGIYSGFAIIDDIQYPAKIHIDLSGVGHIKIIG